MEDFFHQKSSAWIHLFVTWIKPCVYMEKKWSWWMHRSPYTLNYLIQRSIAAPTIWWRYSRERMKDEEYSHFILDIYLPLNRSCIDAWLSNDCETLLSKLKKLSSLQLEYFNLPFQHMSGMTGDKTWHMATTS